MLCHMDLSFVFPFLLEFFQVSCLVWRTPYLLLIRMYIYRLFDELQSIEVFLCSPIVDYLKKCLHCSGMSARCYFTSVFFMIVGISTSASHHC